MSGFNRIPCRGQRRNCSHETEFEAIPRKLERYIEKIPLHPKTASVAVDPRA